VKITKIILNIIIALSLAAVGYLYKDITTVSYDWLGAGKTFFILICIITSIILLRFSIVKDLKSNGINIVLAICSVLVSIYLTKHVDSIFKTLNFLLLAFLIQGTWSLWIKLFVQRAKSIEKIAFFVGPTLLSVAILTEWGTYFSSILIGISLLTLTIISLILLFRKEPI
jgi:hypothetical protein